MTISLQPFIGLTWLQMIAFIIYFVATVIRTLSVTALQVPAPKRGDFPPTSQGENTFDFALKNFNQTRLKDHRSANISLAFALISGLISSLALLTINPITMIQTQFGTLMPAEFGLWLALGAALLIHFAAFGVARFVFYRYR